MTTVEALRKVIDGGYCIGCGACASLEGSTVRMAVTSLGTLQATLAEIPLAPSLASRAATVCPFSDSALDEDQLAKGLFGSVNAHDSSLGYYLSTYAAYVREDGFRASGSSGGLGSWLQCELLRLGFVDHVLNVGSRQPDANDARLFAYQVASSEAEARMGAKSKYYPIELSQVLDVVRRQPGRYALVGLPCFIKAARLLCRQDAVLAERLQWFVGLVCGHLKSMRFAELLAWQMGVPPPTLSGFDFRVKLPDRPANQYAVEAITASGSHTSRGAQDLFGPNWGHGFFKYKACDYCDDVFAETADVVIGDAWLPQYSADPGGTNVLVVRRAEADEILKQAAVAGRLHLEALRPEEAAKSQDAGLRHRREGLRYRLYLADRRNEWHPPKRVGPAQSHLSRRLRARYRLRERMRDLSHAEFAKALASGDLSGFIRALSPLVASHRRLDRSVSQRLLQQLNWLARVLASRAFRALRAIAPFLGRR